MYFRKCISVLWIRFSFCIGIAISCSVSAQPAEKNTVVGSKRFTESYVLGELINLRLGDAGVQALHRQGLGNTAIVIQALKTGQIDVYPEYTGTILREILRRPETQASLSELNSWLKPIGLNAAIPLGFNTCL